MQSWTFTHTHTHKQKWHANILYRINYIFTIRVVIIDILRIYPHTHKHTCMDTEDLSRRTQTHSHSHTLDGNNAQIYVYILSTNINAILAKTKPNIFLDLFTRTHTFCICICEHFIMRHIKLPSHTYTATHTPTRQLFYANSCDAKSNKNYIYIYKRHTWCTWRFNVVGTERNERRFIDRHRRLSDCGCAQHSIGPCQSQ